MTLILITKLLGPVSSEKKNNYVELKYFHPNISTQYHTHTNSPLWRAVANCKFKGSSVHMRPLSLLTTTSNSGYSPNHLSSVQFSSAQSLSHVWLFATPWSTACQASLSITNSRSLPKPMSIELVMPSNHLSLFCPLLLLPPIPPSIRVFSHESALRIRRPKYWSFSFSINPSNEHPGLISFRMDCLDLLAVQGTLKSLLQHNSSKA